MAQIITNTFFDDCEAIKTINGAPTLDLSALSGEDRSIGKPTVVTLDTLAEKGLSRRFFDDFPQSALGLHLLAKGTDGLEISVPLTAIGHVEAATFCMSANHALAGMGVLVSAMAALTGEVGNQSITFAVEVVTQ